MKKIFFILLIIIPFCTIRADEGMWLPSLIEARILDMQNKGLKLSASDLYSVNQACLKDAIVQFGNGCTAELISDKGLLLTNHHCGFSQVQAHSSVEHDYLTDGFWAKNLAEELPNKGLVVRFLVRMDDVTDKVLEGVTENMTEEERRSIIAKNRAGLIKDAATASWLRANVESQYYGNQYFLFLYKEYEDVRLVGAPPSSIGKFGGDTDNWMWPRHTGDFSLFRIYAGKDNNPAPYAADNVPYRPASSLKISLKGIRENDFTFIYGYPGRTNEYLHSAAISYLAGRGNPAKIRLRTTRLDIMREAMDKDAGTRIKYAAKQAIVANAWKKWQGELKGVVHLKTVEKKQALEQAFSTWAADKPEYRHVLPRLEQLYKEIDDYAFARDYYLEAFNPIEIIRYAAAFKNPGQRIADLKIQTGNFFKDYDQQIDQETFTALITDYLNNVPAGFVPPALLEARKAAKGDIKAFVARLYAKTIFTNRETMGKLLEQPADKIAKQLEKDPVFTLYTACSNYYKEKIEQPYTALNKQMETLYNAYMRGLMAFQPQRAFYPDANSTLRIAYGKIAGYSPADAVYYLPQSTIEGIMQKDDPGVYDYDIPQRLRDVYATKDYGRWAVNGSVPVAFIATNHTTGGNSGSPVINGEGHLIGLNFDRTWESTMSDVAYDPDICRNIALDIRYALFVIDKIAGAGYLLDEMTFITE